MDDIQVDRLYAQAMLDCTQELNERDDGSDSETDREVGIKYLEPAAIQGSVLSMELLAHCYERQGDSLMALKWYQSAAEKGGKYALFKMGTENMREQKYCSALRQLSKAATIDTYPCTHPLRIREDELWYKLGDLLTGVSACAECKTEHPLDMPLGMSWLRKAAEAGYANAQHLLATFLDEYQHLYPYKTPKELCDMKESIRWFKAAAEQDHTLAQWDLHQCYARGQGVEKDLDEAKRLLTILDKKNHRRAWEKLFQLKIEGKEDVEPGV